VTPLFGPGWGNYAIRGIIEIGEPEPISLLPQTPGWIALLLLLLVAGLWQLFQRLQRWRRNRYRREAQAELVALRARINAGDRGALRDLAPLLRATALSVDARANVASCTGAAWAARLRALAPDAPPLPVELIHQWAYAPLTDRLDNHTVATALTAVEHWIAVHRGPGD